MITSIVRLPNSSTDMAVSYVYGVNCKNGRELLWEEISALSADPIIASEPWVVLGDFNQSIDPADSSSGSTRISKRYAAVSGLSLLLRPLRSYLPGQYVHLVE